MKYLGKITDPKDLVTKEYVDNKIDYMLPLTNQISSSIVSFDDGEGNLPLKSLIVDITPIQAGSGDPSPTNIRAISGWTGAKITRAGKNLLLKPTLSQTTNDVALSADANGVITLNGTASSSTNVFANGTKEDSLFYLPAGTYNFSDSAEGTFPSNPSNRSQLMTEAETAVTGIINNQAADTVTTFTLTQGTFVYLRIRLNGSSVYNGCKLSPMVTAVSAGIEFEPYTGSIYPISWQSQVGTVYGGKLNITMGRLIVDKVLRTIDGTGTWATVGSGTNMYYRMVVQQESGLFGSYSNAICTHYSFTSISVSTSNVGFSPINSATAGSVIGFRPDLTNYSSFSSFRTYLNEQVEAGTPVQVVYELATPLIYQLTPIEITTLLGTNNIWADCGNVEATYWRQSPLRDDIDSMIPDTYVLTLSLSTNWSGSNPYTQTATLSGYTVTSRTKVDLQPNAAAISQLINDGVEALYIENNNGVLTAYAVGAAPTASLTLQVTVTEVAG